ncbi:MAG: lysophospholipid acyltransferase family protein, partial [Deltaproteobacteria bacterium]|nr:lysophospholipid acyltransferase family protein [Deltaproteobacteria bacterium]
MLKKFKNSMIYYFARAMTWIIAFTPKFLVPFYGLLIGKFAYFTAVKLRDIAISQLMESYQFMTRKRAIVITRGLFIHLAISVIELCRMLRDKNFMPSVSISKSSMNSLNEAFQLNKGVVFITGHIGNWELMAAKLAGMGIPVFTVAKKSYDKRFTVYLMKKRESLGVNPIYRQSTGAPIKMVRALRKNGLLGFLIDQDTDVKSEFVTFFNRFASTPSGAAAFAI